MLFNKVILKTIFIHAPTVRVWDALTKPELIRQWLWEEEVNVISEWKEGSSMIFRGSFHGVAYEDKGRILKFVPGHIFQYNYWSHLSQLPDVPENYLLIEFTLTPIDNGTELRLICSDTINEAIYGHWNFYWNITLGIIKDLVEENGQ